MKNIESVTRGRDMNWLEETNSYQNDATNLTIRIFNLKTERLNSVLHCNAFVTKNQTSKGLIFHFVYWTDKMPIRYGDGYMGILEKDEIKHNI